MPSKEICGQCGNEICVCRACRGTTPKIYGCWNCWFKETLPDEKCKASGLFQGFIQKEFVIPQDILSRLVTIITEGGNDE